MTRRVGELVQEDECALAAVHDELVLVVVALRCTAEDAPVELARMLHVFETPRRPEALHVRATSSGRAGQAGSATAYSCGSDAARIIAAGTQKVRILNFVSFEEENV